MANGVYRVTEEFEKSLCDYTGAPYAVTVDNQSNALFLALIVLKCPLSSSLCHSTYHK